MGKFATAAEREAEFAAEMTGTDPIVIFYAIGYGAQLHDQDPEIAAEFMNKQNYEEVASFIRQARNPEEVENWGHDDQLTFARYL